MTSEHEAKVVGRNLQVSTKQVIEIANQIRGKNLIKTKQMLERVVKKQLAIPYRRFNMDTGHRKGKMGPGRYPVKASKEILMLLESLEANAQNKGLDVDTLYIRTIIPNKGNTVWHYGRHRRRQAKTTHIEIIAEEKEEEKKITKKIEKKEEKKTEEKKEEK
ncbi:MAG: 50S ribosomal protein L22 [Candidatus Nanoarchaeia archaeon]